MRKAVALLACSTLLAFAVGGCATTAAPELRQSATESAEARADQVAHDALLSGPFAGMSIAVSQNGRIIYQKGFGKADVETGRAVTAETRFPIGSITKPITCRAVQALAAEGKIDTDAPVSRYLPNLRSPARDVPVRNLLDHSSGIENYLELPDFPYDKPVGLSREQMTQFFDAQPLRAPTGERFSYSNSNTYLLGLIIEAVSRDYYDRFVARHVFAPLAMTHSDFLADASSEADRALGYNSNGSRFTRARGYDWLVPFSAGAAVSTTADLIRFSDAEFSAKTPKALRKRLMARQRLGDGELSLYTQGCLVEGRLGGMRKFSHSGSIYGFSSHMAHYPDQHLSVVVLTNSQGENYPPVNVSNRIARIFLGQPAPVLKDVSADPVALDSIKGDYDVGHRRLGIDRLGFDFKDGQLQMIYGGVHSGAPPLPLRSLGNGLFVSPIDDEQFFQFDSSGGNIKLTLTYYDGVMPFHKQQ
ncbi:serine hydrolase domain-containing protein [Sphingorhabdus sp.]|jgi:D-alanyl-D-alanine carboxypeptidase|uniref:serine hydrolase domain-containing protein n=1 Tax=Sphingorhabdus sp. TaxID=1902408 RepID=UPI0037C78052